MVPSPPHVVLGIALHLFCPLGMTYSYLQTTQNPDTSSKPLRKKNREDLVVGLYRHQLLLVQGKSLNVPILLARVITTIDFPPVAAANLFCLLWLASTWMTDEDE